MIKYLLILILLIGCSDKNDSGMIIKKPQEACIRGHIYFYSYGNQYGGGYMSPRFSNDMKLIPCSMVKDND